MTISSPLRIFAAVVATAALAGGRTLQAQALPTTTVTSGPDVGFHLPLREGSFSYGISASQIFNFGYNGTSTGGTASSTVISGDLAYVTRSEQNPFSIIYSGGFLGSESSQQPSTTFQNLSLSQVLRHRRDTFVIADTVSYLPESPTVGLSGIPGLGDLGVTPVQVGAYTGPGILTQNESRVSNVVSGSDSHELTGSTSLQGSVTYAIQRFLGTEVPPGTNPGLVSYDSNQFGVSGGILHRIDARNSIGGNYSFQDFSYVNYPYAFRSNGASVEYIHRFSPRLVFDGSAGPQWSSGATLPATYLNASLLLSLTYLAERGSYSAAYTRGTNNGSGVLAGALQDTVGFSASHRFSRVLSGATSLNYAHSSSLPSTQLLPFTFDTEIASAQLSRAIGRYLSVYGSYTIENQSSSQTALLTPLVFNGRSQILGFGITYSPSSLHLGR